LDRDPVRRRIDRIHAVARAVIAAAFLVGIPAATVAASHQVYVTGLRTARAQAAAYHRVPAVVLESVPLATAWRHSPQPPALLTVLWTTSGAGPRSGETIWGWDAAPGSIVAVWTDASGRLTHPPLTHAQIMDHVIGTAVATPLILGIALGLTSCAVSLLCDRRRLARWEADWLVVEQHWTGRR
jgi:hypothetical protein